MTSSKHCFRGSFSKDEDAIHSWTSPLKNINSNKLNQFEVGRGITSLGSTKKKKSDNQHYF